MITVQEIAKALPPNLKSSATQSLADLINNISTDQFVAEQVRKNFIGYSDVLRDGKFKTEDYLNAVTYCSYKLMGQSNQDAYFRTFPARHAALVAKGTPSKDIAAYVSMYNKGKLVNMIMEQTLVPTWVLNQDMHQKALNTQFEIMQDTNVSPKVRVEAANSLLTHLAKPKEAGPLVNIDMRENSGVNELTKALRDLAAGQQHAIGQGTPIRDITHQTIVEAEAKEV